jgi:uncharacterized membrane protein YfhO
MVTPERIEMTVSSSDHALLTLAVPYYPGWRASVNGRPFGIVDVYAGLIGVPLNAGDGQRVVLEFAPTPQIVAGAIAVGVWEWRRSA